MQNSKKLANIFLNFSGFVFLAALVSMLFCPNTLSKQLRAQSYEPRAISDKEPTIAKEQRLKRSLTIYEKALGPDHPDVATALNNLALLYSDQARYDEAEPLYKRALAIREKALGPDHPRVATTLNNLAVLYRNQARYDEAEPLYKRSLAIDEKVLGPDHPGVAITLNNLALLYSDQARYDEAEPLYKRSLAIDEKALGPDHPDVATALNNLALLYSDQARYDEAEPLYKRALAIREKALGPDHPRVATTLNNLAVLYRNQARYDEAEPLYKRSLAIREKALGPDHPRVAITLNNHAVLYRNQARYDEAEPLYKRSLAIREKALGPDHPRVATALSNLALLYSDQARYDEAEPLYKRSLAIDEKALGPDHPDVATTLNNLALLYSDQARYDEAEPLYKRSLAIREKALGPDHPRVATTLNNLAVLYRDQARYDEAEPLYKRSLAIDEKVLGPDHPGVAITLNNLAILYRDQARYDEAEPLYKRSLAIDEKALGPDHPDVATALNNLALLYSDQARYDEAEPLYKRSLTIFEKALGPDHPDVATALNNLALLYSDQDEHLKALPFARRATAIYRRRGKARSASKSLGAESERKDTLQYFKEHASTAFMAGKADPPQATILHEEAFEIIQLAQTSSAAFALAQMTARIKSGNTVLAKTIRSQQDLLGRWRKLDKQLIDELSKPGDKRSPNQETRLRNDIKETSRTLDALNQQLEEEFPQYAELVSSKPLQVAEVQKLLGTAEALLLYNGRYAWVVLQDKFRMIDLGIDEEKLASAVSEIRASFNPVKGKVPPFPHSTAHTLYKKIFEPIETDLSSIRQVMIVPYGPLTSLPFSVLLRSLHTGDGKPKWLSKKYALTTLPSVSSLKALRVLAMKTGPGPDPFTGFGDPVLEGDANDRRGLAIVPNFNNGDKADVTTLRQLPALPETGEELLAIAQSLGAETDTVYLKEEATEARVKALDLSKTDVVAFATHGLIAGEIKQWAEPGLVLTPPTTATHNDDGVLTASEIAQLKLHPGLVILSACNTAASNGKPGAEGLSGLAKAFFYAGSQSLLVSHWAVPSEAAKLLTTGMFERLRENPSLGYSEALRRSMIALSLNQNYRHPIYWAPFVIVGEGT